MLRHQKKHANSMHSNHHHSASDMSDDEQPLSVTPPPQPPAQPPSTAAAKLVAEKVALLDALQKTQNLTELIAKKFLMNKVLGERDDAENRRPTMSSDGLLDCEGPSELIGNLLGISDSSILNKVLLSSADEAAKLLGVEK